MRLVDETLRYCMNRLKRTYGIDNVLPLSKDVNGAVKLEKVLRDCSKKESRESSKSVNDISSLLFRRRDDPEWTLRSLYLQRKL